MICLPREILLVRHCGTSWVVSSLSDVPTLDDVLLTVRSLKDCWCFVKHHVDSHLNLNAFIVLQVFFFFVFFYKLALLLCVFFESAHNSSYSQNHFVTSQPANLYSKISSIRNCYFGRFCSGLQTSISLCPLRCWSVPEVSPWSDCWKVR